MFITIIPLLSFTYITLQKDIRQKLFYSSKVFAKIIHLQEIRKNFPKKNAPLP